MKVLVRTGWAFLLLVVLSTAGHAGFSSGNRNAFYKFSYEVQGEIEVKPDTAVLPLVITVRAKSNTDALNQAKQLLTAVTQEVKALGSEVFSSSPSDFFKPQNGNRKMVEVSFFKANEEETQAKMVFNIYVTFKEEHDFWQRAGFMAKANDFVAALEKKYQKNERINASSQDTYYEISDIERYRGEIIRSIYAKAHNMAEIVAKAEGTTLKVDQVTFDQRIKSEVINFNRESLSLDARIGFVFDKSSRSGK